MKKGLAREGFWRRANSLVLTLMIGAFFSIAGSQEKLELTGYCLYHGEALDIADIYGFRSDREAQDALQRVMDFTGLEPNFGLMAANVPNAAAVIQGTKRMILYNQQFMSRVRDVTQTDWAAISILAHEVGHHLQGHTLLPGGSRPEIELQADSYSGYVLARMGSSMDDAVAAMRSIASEQGSATHPGKSARLAAITNGWNRAREQTGSVRPPPREPPPVEQPRTEDDEGEPEDEPVQRRVPRRSGAPSGYALSACGCWGPTMGGRIPEGRCESGSATIRACGGVCMPYGGSPYAAVCD